jgi:hypothetical protein
MKLGTHVKYIFLLAFQRKFYFIHLFTCAYIVWAISSPYPSLPPSPPQLPSLPSRICSALIYDFVDQKTKA